MIIILRITMYLSIYHKFPVMNVIRIYNNILSCECIDRLQIVINRLSLQY